MYWPLRNSDFIYYDDPTYITSNPDVRQGFTFDGVIRVASMVTPVTGIR